MPTGEDRRGGQYASSTAGPTNTGTGLSFGGWRPCSAGFAVGRVAEPAECEGPVHRPTLALGLRQRGLVQRTATPVSCPFRRVPDHKCWGPGRTDASARLHLGKRGRVRAIALCSPMRLGLATHAPRVRKRCTGTRCHATRRRRGGGGAGHVVWSRPHRVRSVRTRRTAWPPVLRTCDALLRWTTQRNCYALEARTPVRW